MNNKKEFATIEQILMMLRRFPIEKIVEIDLSDESKKYVYFDFNPKTGKYRIVYTKSLFKTTELENQ